MTPPKCWYHLSMLQLLVATAVVAVFTFKNAAYQLSTNHNDIGLISAGWPFNYLSGYGVLASTTTEHVRAGDPWFAGMPKYNPWVLTLNIVLCCLTTTAAVKLVSPGNFDPLVRCGLTPIKFTVRRVAKVQLVYWRA